MLTNTTILNLFTNSLIFFKISQKNYIINLELKTGYQIEWHITCRIHKIGQKIYSLIRVCRA